MENARRARPVCRTAAQLALLLVLPSPAFPWGANGHRAVGRIAESHLTEEAARQVEALLGPETLAQAGTWADEIRSDPAWKHADPWHYINLDEGSTLATTTRNPAGDIVEAIERFTAVLSDPAAPRERRVEALRFLVHFVGDLHQPLHAGKAADRGGNQVEVTWFGDQTNLHSVWDTRLIESEDLSFSELAEFIDHPTPAEVAAWQSATVADWMHESRAELARVYEIGDGKLGYAYAYRNLPLVKRRLLQAGVRLAGLLNATFTRPGPSIPDRE